MSDEQSPRLRLKSWRLANFKSARKATIDFRPLTLLVGANSCGKSTVLQSILLVAQSVQSGASSGAFGLNGQLVNLGNFEDVQTRASVVLEAGALVLLSLVHDEASEFPEPTVLDRDGALGQLLVNGQVVAAIKPCAYLRG